MPDFIEPHPLDRLADDTGLAIAVVDALAREIYVANNNSICRHLNPSTGFSPACAEFCGKALEKAMAAGEAISFECHAGLECRAVSVGNPRSPLVAIVGRTFVKSENYRKARARAISGDWVQYPTGELFENILLTSSVDILNETVDMVEKQSRGTETLPSRPEIEVSSIKPQSRQSEPATKKSTERISNLVERFNREVGLQPQIKRTTPKPDSRLEREAKPAPKRPQPERRRAEAQAWRSFFSSLLTIDYPRAASSVLEFLANHYGFSAMIWLEKLGNRFESTAGFGEMANRKMNLGIEPGDRRLLAASQDELPLEITERAKGPAKKSRTMNLFPIVVGGEISVAISIFDPIEDEAAKKQIARICHSIGPQLEILRLRTEVARSESLASAVRKFSETLKHIDADDLWLNLTQNAAEMLRAERASLLIYDEKAKVLGIKAIIGSKAEPATGDEIGGRVAKTVFSRKTPVAIADVARAGLPPAPADRQYKTSSFLSCPISIGGRTIGVMNFADRAGGLAFDESSLEIFRAIAPQLAVAIDRVSIKEKAGAFEQLSVTDALTGLLNRRYIEERLMEEIKRSNRHGFPMSFMMLDVDNFKSYNDQHGHPAGDEALKLVAHVIRETLRGADVAARFGGEEFSILLPQTTKEEALAIAERIRTNIEHAKFAHSRVTASIGIASCSAELCISANLVAAADKALYEAKRRGRNIVVAFEEMNGGGGK